MRIEAIRSETGNGRKRILADIVWEDCDRPPETVWFATDEALGDSLEPNPHAFLVGCAVPAQHFGERRVRLEGPVCPALRQGVETALRVYQHWYGTAAPQLEVPVRAEDVAPRSNAALFLSGGIDSLATLRRNRLHYTPTHPGYFTDGIAVFGLEMEGEAAYARVRRRLEPLAAQFGLRFLPVYTNVYLNYRTADAADGFRFWTDKFMGAALASAAHALAGRVGSVAISGGPHLPVLRPHGSHPLIEPNYGSRDLRVSSEGLDLSRLDKTRLLADWDDALCALRVCNQFRRYSEHGVNCGRCEKCLRTKLALLAIGKLQRAEGVFAEPALTPTLVREGVRIGSSYTAFCYEELIAPLGAVGRDDLGRELRAKLRAYRRRFRPITGLRQCLKQLDRTWLGGRLGRARRATLPSST